MQIINNSSGWLTRWLRRFLCSLPVPIWVHKFVCQFFWLCAFLCVCWSKWKKNEPLFITVCALLTHRWPFSHTMKCYDINQCNYCTFHIFSKRIDFAWCLFSICLIMIAVVLKHRSCSIQASIIYEGKIGRMEWRGPWGMNNKYPGLENFKGPGRVESWCETRTVKCWGSACCCVDLFIFWFLF